MVALHLLFKLSGYSNFGRTHMPWYVRTSGSTEAVPYETEAAAVNQVQHNIARQMSLGRRVLRDDQGRVSFHDGAKLVESMWVEDEDGSVVPIPRP